MNNILDRSGRSLYRFAKELEKPMRSITGEGVRETLRILEKTLPLSIHEVKSGTKAFDWKVPKEWNISDAYVLDPSGKKIINFKRNYLHVVGYSVPVNKTVSLEELEKHLHSIPGQPNAIPYVTSYYQERWGFCLADRERRKLKKGNYHVVIESSLKRGSLTYADMIIQGSSKEEVLLSTYVCHPRMANDNLSGITMAAHLAKWLMQKKRRYTYRIVFVPETIGSLVYLKKNLKQMRTRTIAGFNITCVGDERTYSFMPSRDGNTLADSAARHVLSRRHPDYKSYSYLKRGGDERQYCAPHINLPIASVMRSMYGTFPEYHTSLDNMRFISQKGLMGAFRVLKECIETIEKNQIYETTVLGEPQLGRRGLFPTLSAKGSPSPAQLHMNNLIGYADGTRDLVGIAEAIGASVSDLLPMVKTLVKARLLRLKERPLQRMRPHEK